MISGVSPQLQAASLLISDLGYPTNEVSLLNLGKSTALNPSPLFLAVDSAANPQIPASLGGTVNTYL
ncbi:MAG: hypothetical protein ACYDGY_03505 [Acidimicrobiales bacterium]